MRNARAHLRRCEQLLLHLALCPLRHGIAVNTAGEASHSVEVTRNSALWRSSGSPAMAPRELSSIDAGRHELKQKIDDKSWTARDIKRIEALHNKHRNDPSTAILTCKALQTIAQHDVPAGPLSLAEQGVAVIKRVMKDHPRRKDIVQAALTIVKTALHCPEPEKQEVRRLMEKNNMESMCIKAWHCTPRCLSAAALLLPRAVHCGVTASDHCWPSQVRFEWSQEGVLTMGNSACCGVPTLTPWPIPVRK